MRNHEEYKELLSALLDNDGVQDVNIISYNGSTLL